MPLIDVTYDGKVGDEVLRRLGELLPDVVGEAVECPEEPSTGPVEPGDMEIRFRKKSPLLADPLRGRMEPEPEANSAAMRQCGTRVKEQQHASVAPSCPCC